ncbi:hypothetical protein, partial [Klebsiella aerogenes]|uniref:hypothetical protein n=1 Tax=Klebsiella aerogenes TaxID=548 RepID=UPI001954B77B
KTRSGIALAMGSGFHKILLNLIIDKYSYLHSYLNRNKYISIFHLFKVASCEVAYQNIQKLE